MPRKDDRVFVKNGFRHYRKTYDLTEVRIGAVLLLGLAVVVAWVMYKGQHPDPSLAALDVVAAGVTEVKVDRAPLPTELTIEGWKEGPVRVFEFKNLYEKINGREGYYKSFGFERLHFVTLEKEDDPTTIVDLELFNQSKAVNALGAYNGERDKEATPEVGEQGLTHYSRNALYLTRGQYYLRAVGSDESEPVLKQLAHVRTRFEAELDGEALPWSYALFLGKLELSPDAIAYFTENAFGFADFAADVNVGRLKDETELFVKVATDEGAATKLAEQFNQGFLGYGQAKAGGFVEDRYIQTISKAASQGPWAYGVKGAPDIAAAAAGLKRLAEALSGFPVPQVDAARDRAPEDALQNTKPESQADPGEPSYDSLEGGEQ